ncbi:MAG TPA: cupin domain-containing protein [Chitinophagaceae bacterium]|nr:cupin domain-containing protein [Chitinophagaceae bacterium]
MKLLLSVFFFLSVINAPIDPVASASYPWKADATIFKGKGAVLAYHELKGNSMKLGDMKFYKADRMERFFIVKKGPVEVVLGSKKYSIDKGSVIFLLPGDKVAFGTDGKNDVEFYEMVYSSIQKPDSARGKEGGASFVMNWNDMVFKPHDKGGVRQLFDRKTVMFNRFDVHVTTLNPGFKSHEPHTHQNEEIILMLDGNAEMTVNTGMVRCNTGDAVYVASMVPHNLVNSGKTAATYFAIQWN